MALSGILAGDASAKDLVQVAATIVNGQSLSAVIDCLAGRAHRLSLPSGFVSADLTFQVTDDGNNFFDLYDKNGEYKIPAASVGASRMILLDFPTFFGIRAFKIRSGTSGSPAAVSGDKAITVTTVPR